MSKILVISPDKCINCRTCEIICSFHKTKEFNPHYSAVTVLSYDEAAVSVPMMCMHCEDPACMKICPVEAIKQTDKGVLIEPARCIGCKLCLSACPLGNISYNTKEKKVVKCDLCEGAPMCAEFCPAGAIEYKEATKGQLDKKKLIAENFKNLFGVVNE